MKNWILKNLNELIVAIGAVFLPSIGILIAVGFLIAIDFVTGLWAAKKRGEVITSRKMSNTVSKLILYNLALLASVTACYLIGDTVPVIKLTAAFLGMVEFKSICENVGSVFGFNLWKAVKGLLSRKSDELEKETGLTDSDISSIGK